MCALAGAILTWLSIQPALFLRMSRHRAIYRRWPEGPNDGSRSQRRLAPGSILVYIDVIEHRGDDIEQYKGKCPVLLRARRQVDIVQHISEHPDPKGYQRENHNQGQ